MKEEVIKFPVHTKYAWFESMENSLKARENAISHMLLEGI